MRPLVFVALLFTAAACNGSTGLPDATLTNAERTDTLYALVGTPVSTPSGYSLEGSRRVRTDLSVDFDFAYNVQADGSRVFLPRAALGIDPTATVNPGFLTSDQTFEAIQVAPSNGYLTDRAIPLVVGSRYVVRSRVTCQIGVPKYAKIEVVSFDDLARTVAFRVLTDDNCGFKGLEPGLPKR
ncbi:MAG TPA: hypothetical protein VGN76_02805 [Gemmatimonadales bacterium]|jgi:hypothetical protein|nr:hypothetical protein [Gemmatimonadales bacterium]